MEIKGDDRMRIGIAMSQSKTQHYINQAYIDLISKSGFNPIAIFPDSDVDDIMEFTDGLLLPGGIDIDPIYYGDDNFSSIAVDPEKDQFERAIFHKYRETGKPTFGICRGLQLIVNEYLLFSQLPATHVRFISHIAEHNQVNDQQLERGTRQHFVEFDTRLYGTASAVDSMAVNSMHHQCLVMDLKANTRRIQNFRMLAWTQRGLKIKGDNPWPQVCEAFEIGDWGGRIRAVQWHPEELADTNLLRSFFLVANNANTMINTMQQ